MKTSLAPSIQVSIFVGGDLAQAKQVCREYCMAVGMCVTVEPVSYIYTAGEQEGVRIGFINYPRFPSNTPAIMAHAISLAGRLMDRLCQRSLSIVGPTETIYLERE